MGKKNKKLLSLLVAFTLMLGTSLSTFASSNETPIVLVSDEQKVIVREVTEEGITIATNDKTTKVLTVENYDSTGENLLSSMTIDLNEIETEAREVLAFWNGDLYQHTFSDREYDVWFDSPNEWTVRSGDNAKYNVTETTRNAANLESFRGYVEDVNEAEYLIIGAVGGTLAVTAITAFLTGGTAAGIAAAGGGTAIVAAFAYLNKACNNADYYFRRI